MAVKLPKKITFKLDLADELKGLEGEDRLRALKEAQEFLKSQILADISNGVSSVSGDRWAKLSDAYKKEKAKFTSAVKANLELKGDLLDAFEVRIVGESLESGWFDESQIGKADGHNNFTGASKLPLRQSIPKKNQSFRPGIKKELKSILVDFKEEQ